MYKKCKLRDNQQSQGLPKRVTHRTVLTQKLVILNNEYHMKYKYYIYTIVQKTRDWDFSIREDSNNTQHLLASRKKEIYFSVNELF